MCMDQGYQWWSASDNRLKWNINGFGGGVLSQEFMQTAEFRAALEVWIKMVIKNAQSKFKYISYVLHHFLIFIIKVKEQKIPHGLQL